MQLQKEKGWEEDEMALSASQNSAKNQNKGSHQRKIPRFKEDVVTTVVRWGHNKENCRYWLKLTKEEQEKADKKAEERPNKSLQHIRCYKCNKMGHLGKDCPEEKKSKDSGGGSGGGFTMMRVEVGELPVEGELDQPNLEANLEVARNPEAQPEQSLSL